MHGSSSTWPVSVFIVVALYFMIIAVRLQQRRRNRRRRTLDLVSLNYRQSSDTRYSYRNFHTVHGNGVLFRRHLS